MLQLRDVRVRYGHVEALHGVSLDVAQGELVSLIGANGAGKSTLLKAISGLVSPHGGTIAFEGETLVAKSPRDILQRGIAHCPEGRRVFPHLSVDENLAMGSFLRRDPAGIKRDLDAMFDRFPRLLERRKQPAGLMSGGEQQMLAFARALMSRPRLILFDEPSLGLAPNLVEQVFTIVKAVRAEKITVLMVEQNARAALSLADRAYLLEVGRVVKTGTGTELLESDDVHEAYLGGRSFDI